MNIKLKHPNAKIPTKAHEHDAGWDLYVADIIYDSPLADQITYDFGVAFAIPPGNVGLVFTRSSVCKMDVNLSNCVGVIDSEYRGSVKAVFDKYIRDWAKYRKNRIGTPYPLEHYKIGDRAAQIVFVPLLQVRELVVVGTLDDTNRGLGGFGSSGLT